MEIRTYFLGYVHYTTNLKTQQWGSLSETLAYCLYKSVVMEVKGPH